MRIMKFMATALCAAALTQVTPANATQSFQGDGAVYSIKKVCRDDGDTRVRVKMDLDQKVGEVLVAYSWKVGKGGEHFTDALVSGDGEFVLFAFTLPSKGSGQVKVGNGPYWDAAFINQTVQAKHC